jgi:hypothetical protein
MAGKQPGHLDALDRRRNEINPGHPDPWAALVHGLPIAASAPVIVKVEHAPSLSSWQKIFRSLG